jgi:hypothetical protein
MKRGVGEEPNLRKDRTVGQGSDALEPEALGRGEGLLLSRPATQPNKMSSSITFNNNRKFVISNSF